MIANKRKKMHAYYASSSFSKFQLFVVQLHILVNCKTRASPFLECL